MTSHERSPGATTILSPILVEIIFLAFMALYFIGLVHYWYFVIAPIVLIFAVFNTLVALRQLELVSSNEGS